MLRRRFFGNKSGAPDESGGSRVLDESGPARPALWRRNNISRAPVDRTEKAETSQLSTEENRHDFLANELLRLTSSMKQNFTVAGTVIREDNEVSRPIDFMGCLPTNRFQANSWRIFYAKWKYHFCFLFTQNSSDFLNNFMRRGE